MTITEKAAYIKGLVDGLELDGTTKEGKILSAIIDLVSDIAEDVTDIAEDVEYLEEYIYELDDDYCDCDDCDEDCCDCDCCDCEDDEYFECECPSCGEMVCFDSSIDPEELTCPACGEKFECIISEDDLEALEMLSKLTNTEITRPLRGLAERKVNFKDVINADEMLDKVYEFAK